MTLSTQSPAPGAEVTVEVVTDPNFPAGELRGLLGLFAADAVNADLRPINPYGFKPVGLSQVQDGVYRGTFIAPTEAGDYVLVPFPNVVDNYPATDIYPTPMIITVTDAPDTLDPLGIGGTIAAVALVALITRRLRQNRRVATLGATAPPHTTEDR